MTKYNIKKRIDRLAPVERSKIKNVVLNRHGIDASTYSRYLRIEMQSRKDIGGSILKTFSELLKVSVEELFNHER